jgi:hypothetical protein
MNAEATASLEEVLAYANPGVVRRYLKEHGGSQEEAEEVFRETLKWLYLCHRGAESGFACSISPELEKVDRMWHAFLLFTLDYAEFCERHFGAFLHHVPDEAEEGETDEGDLRERLVAQLGLICDALGEGTLIAWYDECRYAVPACGSATSSSDATASPPSWTSPVRRA